MPEKQSEAPTIMAMPARRGVRNPRPCRPDRYRTARAANAIWNATWVKSVSSCR